LFDAIGGDSSFEMMQHDLYLILFQVWGSTLHWVLVLLKLWGSTCFPGCTAVAAYMFYAINKLAAASHDCPVGSGRAANNARFTCSHSFDRHF